MYNNQLQSEVLAILNLLNQTNPVADNQKAAVIISDLIARNIQATRAPAYLKSMGISESYAETYVQVLKMMSATMDDKDAADGNSAEPRSEVAEVDVRSAVISALYRMLFPDGMAENDSDQLAQISELAELLQAIRRL